MATTKLTKEQRAARADLRRKVRGLMKDAERLAMEKLANIEDRVLAQHMAEGENFAAPKDFICAFSRELERQYQRPYPTREQKRRQSDYYERM